jgi:hypothetical protein
MRRFTFLAVVIMLSVSMGCDRAQTNDADADLQRKTEKSMQEANAQIGMPAIKNFQERKLAKMIFELRDQENLVCYAYIQNYMTGELVFVGKCIGYGLPYSVQYTNPEKVVHKMRHNGGSFGTLPQADPNGLFMPTGLSATWLMMIDPSSGKPRPVYFEPQVVVSPFPLKLK